MNAERSSMEKKHTPKRGEVVVVSTIPPCNFCQDGTPGPYDFATVMGPWANGCEEHYQQYRAAATLGTGKGQLWITEDQVADPEAGQADEGQRRMDVLRGFAQGTIDLASFLSAAKAMGISDDEIEAAFQ